MSRSLGALSLMTWPPIFSSPSVMSSSPATIRSAVDFPQPGRADEDHELAVGDVEVHVLDGLVAVAVALGDVLESDLCHWFLLIP